MLRFLVINRFCDFKREWERDCDMLVGYKGFYGKISIDVIGGICWVCSFYCILFCVFVMGNNNENEFI